MLVVCPTDPPSTDPSPPFDQTGDPDHNLPDGCRTLVGMPVLPQDSAGLSVPATIPGKWAYQVCGDPAVAAWASGADDVQGVKYRCAHPLNGKPPCSVVVFWQPANPNAGDIPVAGRDGGGPFAFNRFPPDARSNPPNGNVIAQFPTWFWDNNMVGFLAGAIPVPDFGVGAIAIYIGSEWEVDGHGVCPHSGDVPLRTDTGPSPRGCGATFTANTTPGGGRHRAELTKTWLIIIFLAFPPYVIIFPVILHSTIDINVHEVQADSAR
jgi:hypothetical protein